MSTAGSDTLPATTGSQPQAKSLNLARNGEFHPAWQFLVPDPQELVTLKVGGKSFSFRKSILVKDSEYFAACLNSTAFVEGRTSTIEFDDIEPEYLGFYLHITYCREMDGDINELPVIYGGRRTTLEGRLVTLVRLYQLADRFINKSLVDILGKSIIDFDTRYSVYKRKLRDLSTPTRLIWWTKTYRDAFGALEKHIPDQQTMRTKLTDIFCDLIPLSKVDSIIHVVAEDQEFMQAVLLAVFNKAAGLESDVARLRTEVSHEPRARKYAKLVQYS
ncbi:hypothetical protein EsH8_VI_000321 [Colletotrichum jinshuiense]